MLELAHSGAQAYLQVDVETGDSVPSPQQLIVVLFEGVLTAVLLAKQHLLNANAPAKSQAISKAVSIITGGLRASLDKSHNTNLAEDLDILYGHLCNRLILANLHCQPDFLDETYRLLFELKQAWEIAARCGGQIQLPPSINELRSDPNARQLCLMW
jgi:flagellar protein FliS